LNISYLRQENKKYIGIMKHMCTIRNIEQYSKLLTRKVQAVQGRFRRYKEGSGGTIASNQNVSLKNTYYIMKIKKEISIV